MLRYSAVYILILALFLPAGAFGQYSDVLVVVNSNSSVSVNVGNYFKTQRSIPSQNICTISCTTAEEIDSLTFESIRTSIQNYMSSNGLVNSTNYIVTTKGIPLKVHRSGSTFSPYATSSSFDGELTMIFSNLSSSIGNSGGVSNPYYNSTNNFSRSNAFSKIYLVTRLDGYTYDDITGLIDRAKMPYHSEGAFIFDQDPSKGGSTLNTNMTTASATLNGRGYNTLLNTTSDFVVEQTNVLGYVSWGTNDAYWSGYTQKAQPHNSWSPKAIAETYVSSSARTFTDSNYVDPDIGNWQSLIADLIHENGVTGAKGYVYEPYSSALCKVNILFDRWGRPTTMTTYNLAESFYAASQYIGWMDVVIGDPKAKFAIDGHLPVQLVSFGASFKHDKIQLRWKTATEINNYGFEVQKFVAGDWTSIGFVEGHGTVNTPQDYSFTDPSVGALNRYRLKQIDRDGTFEYSTVAEARRDLPQALSMDQNYPNPFNPSTTITYALGTESSVRVQITDMAGRVVRTFPAERSQTPGVYSLRWEGESDNGTPAASGTYLCSILATSSLDGAVTTQSRKMVLLR